MGLPSSSKMEGNRTFKSETVPSKSAGKFNTVITFFVAGSMASYRVEIHFLTRCKMGLKSGATS